MNNDNYIINSPNVENLLDKIKDKMSGGGSSTGSFEVIVVDNGVVGGYQASGVIPYGATAIGNNAFNNCYGLTQITIPDSVTTIYADVFKGCRSLKQIYIPNSVTNIVSSAFDGFVNATINCEFAEGAVSGAPWGAGGGVTINYNVPRP